MMLFKKINKEELNEVKEFHYEKIRRLCQKYIDNELNYKTGISDSRLIEINKLITNLTSEIERINGLINILIELDNEEKN